MRGSSIPVLLTELERRYHEALPLRHPALNDPEFLGAENPSSYTYRRLALLIKRRSRQSSVGMSDPWGTLTKAGCACPSCQSINGKRLGPLRLPNKPQR